MLRKLYRLLIATMLWLCAAPLSGGATPAAAPAASPAATPAPAPAAVPAAALRPAAKHCFSTIDAAGSGLSNDYITAMTTDSRGFVWIGTASGLNQYDGLSFVVYYASDLGLGTAYIRRIMEDSEGDIWVGTDTGLSRLNRAKGRFVPMTMKSDKGTVISNRVSDIKEDADGAIWVSVGDQGIFKYDKSTGRLYNYFCDSDGATLPIGITSFCFDGAGGLLYALYYNNLYHIGIAELESGVRQGVEISPSFRGDDIVDLYRAADGYIYAAGVASGLSRIDWAGGTRQVLIPSDKGFVRAMSTDGRTLVMATDNGVWEYNTATGAERHFAADPSDMFSLKTSNATAACLDGDGGLWVGTSGYGVSCSIRTANLFEKYYRLDDGTPLRNSRAMGFAYDGHGNVLVGTGTEGVLRYSLSDGSLRRFGIPGLTGAPVRHLAYRGRQLFLGGDNQLRRLDTVTGAVRSYKTVNTTLGSTDNRVFSIVNSALAGTILVGTSLGLCSWKESSDSFVPVKEMEGVFIDDITEDGEFIWVATFADGIFQLDPSTLTPVANYRYSAADKKSLPNNKCYSVSVDRDGDIWVTTAGSGFAMLDRAGGVFRRFDMSTFKEIPTNVFYSAVPDRQGRIWLTSDKGLLLYDKSTSRITCFTGRSGLLNGNFLGHSALDLGPGGILFGSADGFVRFFPKDFTASDKGPDPVITGFLVDGVPFATERSVDLGGRVKLGSGTRSFGFSISPARFSPVGAPEVRYQLLGFDNAPLNVPPSGLVEYDNIPPGRYTFRLTGHPDIEVKIFRKPMRSILAMSIYLLLAFAFISYLGLRVSRQRMDKERRRSEEKAFREKMTFFSSVIHEIKTPLMLIRAPLRNILSGPEGKTEAREDLELIGANADYLSGLVDELLDYVRIERSGYVPDCRKVAFRDVMTVMQESFRKAATDRNIVFTMDDSACTDTFVRGDESAIKKILNNLLHNAIKYAGSHIDIRTESGGGMMRIRISNDGPAIPEAKREEIFKPFVQAAAKGSMPQSGVGIGLALARSLCELQGGSLTLDDNSPETCFVVSIPLWESTDVEPVEVEVEPAAEEDSAARPVILIVEDNKGLSGYLARQMKDRYSIVAAESAEEALEKLSGLDPALILSDIAMRGMSGIEFCRRVTSDIATSHIPVILMSAFNSPEVKVESMKSGAAMYVEKPFDMDYLVACIGSVLDKSRPVQSGHSGELSEKQLSVSRPDQAFIEQLEKTIEENLPDANFAPDSLASMMSMSKATLSRKIKALLGTSPGELIKTRRLETAARMLQSGKCRINEVCYSVGFNTPFYFSKCFKEKYGVLPSEYTNSES